jgi:formylglycine-generating enzyme required for sulfatase activity/tRNA A-37 threonylcarbamoyl transferase component Bud32
VTGPLQPGAVFGKDFRILQELRAGGMGAVYIVEQLSTGKQRALKVMARELATDPSIRERFVLEARAASRIESDHVVEIVTAGVDEESGAPFLVMELLRGEELGDAVTRLGHLLLGDVAEILAQIGHALERAHANGIVHRDLKLENIFLATSKRRDANFTAKILDFGIAKLVADSRQQDAGTQPLGTPLFMSPEQTDRRGRISPATDVWALGLIAFRLLTGRDFWREADGSLPMLLREIVVDPIPPASLRARELGVAGALPPGFDGWFARCVNREIDGRFPEAGAAVAAFAQIVPPGSPRGFILSSGQGSAKSLPSVASSNVPVSASAATVAASGTAPTRRAWVAWVIAGVVVLAGAGGTAGVFLFAPDLVGRSPRPSPPKPAQAPSQAAAPPSASARPPTACPAGSVLVKGGTMYMGARDIEDAEPHEVKLSPFCMDRTEVTTGAYMACVAKGECERPPDQVSANPPFTKAQTQRFSALCNASHADRSQHPINCVAWDMASNYCHKRRQRLPTEAEWEFAARGSSQEKYPWGRDAPSAKYLNACGKECVRWGVANGEPRQPMYEEDDGFPATAPVGSFPAGATPSGVMDLAGNVWEWTADWYGPYGAAAVTDPAGPPEGTKRVARGGDFFGYDPKWARPAYRWKSDPGTYNHAIGFRCAADPHAKP